MNSKIFPPILNSCKRNNISQKNSKSFLINDSFNKINQVVNNHFSKSKERLFVKFLNKNNTENSNILNHNYISARIIKFSKNFQILAKNLASGINLGKYHCEAEFELLLKEKSSIIIQKYFRGHRIRKIYKNVD